VRPLDVETLKNLLERHQAVVTVEDNALVGGFGSAVVEVMVDAGISRPVRRLGLPDAFVTHGPVEVLRVDVGLTPTAVAEAAKALLHEIEGRHR
jgi:1-deoxy-D-xylulose-5-phosphate synthase